MKAAVSQRRHNPFLTFLHGIIGQSDMIKVDSRAQVGFHGNGGSIDAEYGAAESFS
jgi:hypothetical protein